MRRTKSQEWEYKLAELRNKARELKICPQCLSKPIQQSDGILLCENCEKLNYVKSTIKKVTTDHLNNQ